jgi:hypothetical protein
LTSQVTLVFVVPFTVAAKFIMLPGAIVAAVGEIVILVTGLIDTLIAAVFDGSATAVAAMVTCAGDGAMAGAV